ncbi:MBL fold metallo-hydrolase [Maridesulfovibrio sp.]|uniref:MBL fold metallo-hydrolase n=1 Tax=Maridesulfovibrio sp. TaxID=2795000 RepID=UPI0029CAA8F8|nr:MBL fold metallo-hydrolase [Maridesulfovibrio sp.]
MNYVDVTLVANAGVLVRYNGTNILIDGIHYESGHPFCKVSPMDLQLMKTGTPPFERLDYLLFSHEHPDHFTPALVCEQLKNRPVKFILMPDGSSGSKPLKELLAEVRERDIRHRVSSLGPGEFESFKLEKDLKMTVIGTRHMGPQYQDLRNDCFMLEMGETKILFTGDADHVAEYYEKPLLDVELEAVFVNPLFYHNREGRRIINEIFRPQNVVVYHMPNEHNDPMQLRLTVERAREKYVKCGLQTYILQGERQQLRFWANNL